jgi:UDP-GlcNAc:undecaprenyl-phosphate GlcNAc-1-phosphate transferase
MGDTGSQFLGLAMSAMSLLENRKGTAATTLLLPLVALAVPLADSTVAFLRRFVRGQHVFRGDTEHIHHRILSLGLSVRAATLTLWALAAFCGAIAVLLSMLPRSYAALLTTVLAAVLYVTFEGLRFVRRERERRAAAEAARRRR